MDTRTGDDGVVRMMKPRPDPRPTTFGRHHFTLMLKIEAAVVGKQGVVDERQLRCSGVLQAPHPSHPEWRPEMATERADRRQPHPMHDDWCCLEELVTAGWVLQRPLVEGGATMKFELTNAGWAVSHALRRMLGEGREAVSAEIAIFAANAGRAVDTAVARSQLHVVPKEDE